MIIVIIVLLIMISSLILLFVRACKVPKLACEQAPHLGESREVTREQHAKGNAGPIALPGARTFSRGSFHSP